MTISKDLYLAILSMDAYNRGYGAGVADGGKDDTDGLGDSSNGTAKIGNATVSLNLTDAGLAATAQTAGFYAVAYDDPTYGMIISYRGTDNPSIFASDVSDGADITKG